MAVVCRKVLLSQHAGQLAEYTCIELGLTIFDYYRILKSISDN